MSYFGRTLFYGKCLTSPFATCFKDKFLVFTVLERICNCIFILLESGHNLKKSLPSWIISPMHGDPQEPNVLICKYFYPHSQLKKKLHFHFHAFSGFQSVRKACFKNGFPIVLLFFFLNLLRNIHLEIRPLDSLGSQCIGFMILLRGAGWNINFQFCQFMPGI